MTRTRDLALLAGAVVLIAAHLVWWLPTLALRAAPFVLIVIRHHVILTAVDLLYSVRCDRTARRVLAGSMRRNRRAIRIAKARVQAARERRGLREAGGASGIKRS